MTPDQLVIIAWIGAIAGTIALVAAMAQLAVTLFRWWRRDY